MEKRRHVYANSEVPDQPCGLPRICFVLELNIGYNEHATSAVRSKLYRIYGQWLNALSIFCRLTQLRSISHGHCEKAKSVAVQPGCEWKSCLPWGIMDRWMSFWYDDKCALEATPTQCPRYLDLVGNSGLNVH